MTAYFVAHITVTDADRMQDYRAGFQAIFAKYKGKVLAIDGNFQVVHGELSADRFVIVEFPSEADLRDWHDSAEYQELAQIRFEASDSVDLIVHGL